MTNDELDAQLRAMAHRAAREIYATPVRRRPLERRERTWTPLALAAAVIAVIAIGAPLAFGHALRGGTAGQNQPPEINKNAGAILQDMAAAMTGLHAYHVIERGTASDGSPVVIDLRSDRTGSAELTWTMGSETDAVVIWHGDLFVKGPSVVPDAAKAIVGDHWYGLRAGAYAATLAAVASPAHVIDCLTGDHGALAKDGVRDIDGTRALRLVSTATSPDARSFTLDVAVEGAPYALHMETDASASSRPECQGPSSPTGDTQATPDQGSTGHQVVDFDSFDTSDLITPPSDVIDSSALATVTP